MSRWAGIDAKGPHPTRLRRATFSRGTGEGSLNTAPAVAIVLQTLARHAYIKCPAIQSFCFAEGREEEMVGARFSAHGREKPVMKARRTDAYGDEF
jgi:hypothetical protein